MRSERSNAPLRMPTDWLISRRSLLEASAALVAVTNARLSAAQIPLGTPGEPARPRQVIDCHSHLRHHSLPNWEANDRGLIDASDRLGIDQLCCSILTPTRPATAAGFRECNHWVADAIKRYPNRILGYCYVNPGHQKEALEEIRRCVEDRGFIGIKLYNEFLCTDPIIFPIVELAIELRVPILHHAGHSHHPLENQPNISDGGKLALLAKRYPEAMLICAHISGGGDWQWTIRALRHAPTVFLDLSGSVPDAGIVDMAAQVLGPDRLLFGCDLSMTQSVGRLQGASLSLPDRRKILGENMERLLARRRT